MPSSSNSHKTWTLVAVCLGTFMLLLDITIVVVALPDIRSALHTSFSDVQWTIDAYSLSLASLLLATGSLADIYGRRLVFVSGLAIFTVGSLLCALAQTPLMLVLCRAGQGIGGAAMFATSLALLAQTFQGRERGMAFGIWGFVAGASTALGPVLGGALTSGLGWRWIFLVNLPIGVVAITIALTRVREFRPPQAPRIDVPGFITFTAALIFLIYGLIYASEHSFSSSVVWICVAIAIVLLAVFGAIELRSDHPMFDLKLFRIPTFLGGSAAAFGINGSLYAVLLFLVIYLQDGLRYDAMQTGLRLATITALTLVTAPLAGRLTNRVPVRLLVGGGLLITGVGLLLMGGLSTGSSWTHFLPGFIVAGAGSGFVNPPLASTAVGVVPQQRAGAASGINTTFRQVGIATSVAALGSIFATHTNGKTGAALAQAYVSGINELVLIAGVIALVAGVLALVLIRGRDFIGHAPAATPAAE